MGKYTDEVERLGKETNLSNYEIAEKVGCKPRTVRRILGPHMNRIKARLDPSFAKTAVTPAKAARILLLDIESSPMEVYVWQLFKNNYINPDFVIKDWSILTWSAKWLFEPKIMTAKVSTKEATAREDASILLPLWNLLDQANMVIAHNGARYDVKKMNTRFAKAGYKPPMPYRMIDTLTHTRRVFAMSSYKLDYINKFFDLEGKSKHEGFNMWKRCVNGDETALDEMMFYNESDVRALEELYLRIRPWIKGHPPVGLYIDTDGTACTNCGNEDVEWGGAYFTPAGRYAAFRCNICGAIGRSRTSDLTKEERKMLCLSVAN
jgi:DNA-binding CsgD family transcriptional regulator